MTINDEDHESRFSRKQRLFQWLNRPIRLICGFLLVLWPEHRRLLAMLSRTQPERRPANVTFVDFRDASTKEAAEALHRRRIIGRSAAAAVVGIVLISSFVAFHMDVATPSSTVARATVDAPVATEINDVPTTRQLDDGSTVSYDSRARLQFDFTDKRRDVHVIVGKAMFQVAEDKAARPFRAATLLLYATAAAGTNFSIEVDRSVAVHVHEGVVQLARRGARAGAPVMTLRTGERAEVRADEFVALLPGGIDGSRAELVDNQSFPRSCRSSAPPIGCHTEPSGRRRRVA